MSVMHAAHALKSPMDEFLDVKGDLTAFSARFEHLILEKKSALQLAKKQHTDKVTRLEQNAQDLRNQITAALQQKSDVAENISAEISRFSATESMVDGLERNLQAARAMEDALSANLLAKSEEISAAQKSLKYAHTHVAVQEQMDVAESTKFEMYAGLKIEAVDEDVLRLRFSNIDASDIDREVSCELDVSGEQFRVGDTLPRLSADQISAMERQLNEKGVFVQFLRQIRKSLKEAIE
ncbi:hypothetical protein OXX80_003429 [Metschnikowia pulcherrima]